MSKRWYPKITRDLFLFGMGVVFAVNEVIIRQGPERPTMLVFIGTMLGLPAILRANELNKKNGSSDDKSSE